MSSLDVRNNSAVMKRAEQLKRWEESDTNRQPPTPRPERGRKIKFSSGCVFLAACMSGDKEEVLKLLESGADINTANVDGLTALHQACIDDNLEMVEFLIEHGADINRQDNEGWTPLHATASCGFVSIARYLVEHGADPAAVNSDGDLAVDLAVDIQHLAMMDFMQKVMTEHNIDCEKARQAEEQLMLSDAKKWLRSDASEVDRPHPKTGATALHVAAAKGYTKVISLLLAGRANVDKQDNDGWTPLHAASHWGQKEAADMLVNAMADMDIRNYAGQTCIDVADRKMAKFLEELRSTSNKRVKRRPSSQIRISDKIENHIDNTPTKIIRVEVKSDQSKDQANASITENELPMIDSSDQLEPHNLARIAEYDETDSELTDSTESSHSTSLSEPEDEKSKQSHETVKPSAVATTDNQTVEDEAPWRRNSLARARTQNESPTKILPEKDVSKTNNTTETSDVILRRTQSFEHDEKFYQKYHELRARIKANSCPILPAKQQQLNNSNNSSNSNSQNNNSNSSNSNNNINNNSNNSNNINNSKSNINTNIINNPTSALGNVYTPIPNYSVQRSASLKDHRNYRTISTNTSSTSITAAYTTSTPTTADSTTSITTTGSTTTTPSTTTTTTPIRSAQNSGKGATSAVSTNSNNNNNKNNNNNNNTNVNNTITANNNNNNGNNNNNNDTKQSTSSSPDAAAPTTTVAAKQKMSAGTIFKNFFKSFVPPVRDEESETQRKAHAKRVRETRRSTQGVTLDEIKSAEELVKKKNSNMNNNNNSSSNETQVATAIAGTIPTTSEQQEVEAIEPPHTEPSVAATQTLPTTETPLASQSQIADGDETTIAEQQASRADCTPAEESDREEEEEKECDQQDDEAAVDNDGEDVSASFTIVAPTRKNSSTKATMLDDTTTDDATTTDDNDEEVSATYTLTPRHSFVGSAAPTETVETTIVVTPPEIIINESDLDSETVRKKAETYEMEDENVPENANKLEIDVDVKNENADESSESEQQNENEEATEIANLSKVEDVQAVLEADDEEELLEEKAVDAEEEVESDDSEIVEINEFENEKTESSATKELATNEISAPKSHISTGNSSVELPSVTQTERARHNTLIPLPLVGVASTSVAHATDATPATPTSTSANTPTLESPVRLRDKRIPYDPDSNNALTLAERLRYEASKYSAVGDSDESSSSSTVVSKTRSLPPASLASDADAINELSTNYGKISLSSRRSLDSSSLSLHGNNESQAAQASSNDTQTLQSAISSISSCSSGSGTAFVATTTTATAPSSSNSSNNSTMAERRPSWRLKFDAGCKFKLEDASSGNTFPPNNSTIIPSAPAVIAAANLSSTISQRRINSNSLNSSNQSLNSIGRPVSAPVNATTSTTLLSNDTHSEGVSIFGRRLTGGSTNSTYSSSATTPAATTTTSTASTTTANVTAATANSASKTNDDKDNDKENDNRNLAAQSAIQRRRKPKRRSTGVVHIDMDELDPERQDSANDAEEKDKEKESGGERGASRSRLSSTTNANTNANSTTDENKARDRSENGEAIDYKALWEAVKLENDKLKQQLKKKDDEIVQSRATLERFTNATTKNSLSELEKRERRAMERKLSEMEEELKLLQKLKTENERLRAENRALTRVVSKLTTSAQSQLAKKSK
ncbi:protein phosphatase 1 regulatory subunit 12A isoform X2 [Bactrocera neohumeralis]|uniref:protein phosphatase 1 regulatory subunit 12A isoform X2 n=1 Tax=Bactrocera neohumeralis TaxID=98809 RepID=UPI0021657153|nr:protein phosphatase 1 regulatory subunit 12A isoform X2 [Bactrocera neohumeralis]